MLCSVGWAITVGHRIWIWTWRCMGHQHKSVQRIHWYQQGIIVVLIIWNCLRVTLILMHIVLYNYYAIYFVLSQGVRRLGAASVDMCHVALGIVEAYWEYRLKPWDMAAGVLVNIILSSKLWKLVFAWYTSLLQDVNVDCLLLPYFPVWEDCWRSRWCCYLHGW